MGVFRRVDPPDGNVIETARRDKGPTVATGYLASPWQPATRSTPRQKGRKQAARSPCFPRRLEPQCDHPAGSRDES